MFGDYTKSTKGYRVWKNNIFNVLILLVSQVAYMHTA